jgi:hypothetical protein
VEEAQLVVLVVEGAAGKLTQAGPKK